MQLRDVLQLEQDRWLMVIESEVCQGCLLSLILFLCAIEPLVLHIKQDPGMHEVLIPRESKEETKVLAYMDDQNVLCQNKCAVESTLAHMDL